MAYAPGFANDIFISYAHADNTELWVDRLHERLLNRLRMLERGAGFTVWRDAKLSGADRWSDEIDRQLKSSAILISVLSPNGLDSNWCQQERQRFEQAARGTGGFRLADKIRAIKLTKTPSAGDRHREVFGTLGYEFYRRSEQAGNFTEFHPESPEFDRDVQHLAQEVFDLLQRIRARALAPGPDVSVYVAAAHSDLEDWRDRAVRQLAAWNCRVLPEAISPSKLSATAIGEALSHCSLSLHCVGAKRAITPEDETLPLDVLQLDRARAVGVERIVCQLSAPHPALQELLKQPFDKGPEELVQPATSDVLLQLLEDRITALRKSAPAATPGLPTVYVVCDPSEYEAALRLKTCLEAECRYAATLPMREVDDKSAWLRDHRATLKACEAVLLYWGSGARESWFRDQQREIIGARQKRRKKPLPAVCISSSPQANPAAYSRPDLPFEQVPDLDCHSVRRFFRHLEPDGMKP